MTEILQPTTDSCASCAGVVVMDGRPMYCESCGRPLRERVGIDPGPDGHRVGDVVGGRFVLTERGSEEDR